MELTKTNDVLSLSKGYKQTEVGLIPEDWTVTILSEISEKVMVGIASAATHAYRNKGVVLFRNQNIKQNYLDDSDILHVTEEYELQFKGKRLQGGDLLTARTGYPGTTCVVPDKYELAQSFTTLISRPVKSKVDAYYLSYYINSDEGLAFFERSKIGGGQKNVNAAILKLMPIPLPPTLTEQKAIATALSDVDALISKLENLIAKKKAIKQGAMQELLTPKDGWSTKTLKEVSTYRRGSFPQPYGLPKWYDDITGMPFVQVVDVANNRKLKPETKQKISAEGAKMSVFVKKGSVILTIQGSIGRICITQYDAYVDRTLLIFESFLEEFNKFFFMTVVHQKFEIEKEKAPGGIIKTITKEALSSFEISFPDIEEQNRIAQILSDMDLEIEALEAKKAKYQGIKQGMMQELLTGKTRLV